MDHRASLLNALPHLRHDKPTTNATSQLHSPYGLPITDHLSDAIFVRATSFVVSQRRRYRRWIGSSLLRLIRRAPLFSFKAR